ncbi:MAG: hypothetical protein HQ534_12465 [Armatimonadetes bacterium]|nr:hypothetical protein [Armatimonadota bacterium]
MQLDMHYYGTYVMARAAGIKSDAALIIAYAAQFVDDNAGKQEVNFKDAGKINAEATAHHAFDGKNLDENDQRQVWVPFHFLPGNEGSSFTKRLICRKNSIIAREMIEHNLSHSDKDYALELLGITAHVYADTFAHYGFSGVSSRKNKIINSSIEFQPLKPRINEYITEKEKEFRKKYKSETGLLTNIKSSVIEVASGALGHGAVATYPDRPYLVWNFEYEEPKRNSGLRKNPVTFLKGCEALHKMFRKFTENNFKYAESSYTQFSSIKSEVKEIILTQANKEDRILAWKNAVTKGKLSQNVGEEIPKYDENIWHNQRNSLDKKNYSRIALNKNVYRFYQAASVHRNFVLRTLLPKYGLVVA